MGTHGVDIPVCVLRFVFIGNTNSLFYNAMSTGQNPVLSVDRLIFAQTTKLRMFHFKMLVSAVTTAGQRKHN